MSQIVETQQTIQKFDVDTYIPLQVDKFLKDRKSSRKAVGTIRFYTEKLDSFLKFCDSRLITSILELTPDIIRDYMLSMEGHNPGGQHGYYRALRAFLRWYDDEMEPEHWKNPIRKVKAPKVPFEILEYVSSDNVKLMIDTCDKNSVYGLRDIAILYLLYDTGIRASELLNLDRNHVFQDGSILIHLGKGKKDRNVLIGKKTKAAIRKYLKARNDNNPVLFLSRYQDRIEYNGLRAIITRRSLQAHIHPPSLHSFRRAFAINMLRAGVDIHVLAKLMGHSNIFTLIRYLKIDDTDIRAAHKRGNPVDNIL
ncbi:MAG: tyrosine-type recombinase/integrase [Anaerolineaceae bacterium]